MQCYEICYIITRVSDVATKISMHQGLSDFNIFQRTYGWLHIQKLHLRPVLTCVSAKYIWTQMTSGIFMLVVVGNLRVNLCKMVTHQTVQNIN